MERSCQGEVKEEPPSQIERHVKRLEVRGEAEQDSRARALGFKPWHGHLAAV